MTAMRKIEIELPEHLAQEVDRKVASGEYSDASAVIVDALEPSPHEEEIERWLIEQVVPTYDRRKRENTPGLTSAEVFDGLEARYLARKRGE